MLYLHQACDFVSVILGVWEYKYYYSVDVRPLYFSNLYKLLTSTEDRFITTGYGVQSIMPSKLTYRDVSLS